MPNRAYASLWLRDFTEENMLEQFERFLATIPLTTHAPAFTEFVVRAVDWTETPVDEHDLRPQEVTPAEIIGLAREHRGRDVCFEVGARWDLWMRDMESAKWTKQPVPLSLFCFGPEFDDEVCGEQGHLMADIGFEHVFTGHAGLLTSGPSQAARPEHPDEARFLMWMSRAENFREYQEKTRENITKLMEWVRAAEAALPVQRTRLWSEGESNFEARLDAILAVP